MLNTLTMETNWLIMYFVLRETDKIFEILLRSVEFLMVVKANSNMVIKFNEFECYKSSVMVYMTTSEAIKSFQ